MENFIFNHGLIISLTLFFITFCGVITLMIWGIVNSMEYIENGSDKKFLMKIGLYYIILINLFIIGIIIGFDYLKLNNIII